jgi:hypothetical protein
MMEHLEKTYPKKPRGKLAVADKRHTHNWRLIASHWDETRKVYVIGEARDPGGGETRERTSTTHP